MILRILPLVFILPLFACSRPPEAAPDVMKERYTNLRIMFEKINHNLSPELQKESKDRIRSLRYKKSHTLIDADIPNLKPAYATTHLMHRNLQTIQQRSGENYSKNLAFFTETTRHDTIGLPMNITYYCLFSLYEKELALERCLPHEKFSGSKPRFDKKLLEDPQNYYISPNDTQLEKMSTH